jgi:predicted DNA-binding transcriptional regulator AlpA
VAGGDSKVTQLPEYRRKAKPYFRSLRFAALRPAAARKEFFSTYPALIPQRVTRAIGNVPGYYHSSRRGRDWVLRTSISRAGNPIDTGAIYLYDPSRMRMFSTQEVAKQLGIAGATLSRYISAGKVPTPKQLTSGGMTIHAWTQEEIEHVRELLPKIANGRKTRYQKLREKPKAQPRTPQPQGAKTARAGGPGAVPRKKRKPKKK